VKDIEFTRDAALFPTQSVQHYRRYMERNFGPIAQPYGLRKKFGVGAPTSSVSDRCPDSHLP